MGGFKPSRKLLILQAMEQDRKRKEELERKHRGYDSLVKTSYTGIKEDENEAKPAVKSFSENSHGGRQT